MIKKKPFGKSLYTTCPLEDSIFHVNLDRTYEIDKYKIFTKLGKSVLYAL